MLKGIFLNNFFLDEYNSEEDEMSAQELIDFSPVYRCLYISKVLGFESKFETYYRSQRLKQVRLVVEPVHNMVYLHIRWFLNN